MNETDKKPGVIRGLLNEIGFDDADKGFFKDTVKDLVKEGVKEQIFGKSRRNREIPTTKLHKWIDALKGAWWVPAAVMGSMMFVALGIKWFFKLMMA